MPYSTRESIKYYEKVLKKKEPFSFLEDDMFENVLDKVQVRKYQEGSYVFKQGDTNKKTVFIVLKGKVELLSKDKRGKEVKQKDIHPYDFFGISTFFSSGNYLLSAKACEVTDCLLIDENTFEEVAEENPKFSHFFKKSLGGRVKELYENYMLVEQGNTLEEHFSNETYFWMPIRDNMITNVVVCNKTDIIKRVAKIMEQNYVSSVVVLDDEDNKVYGIITERDLVQKIVAMGLSPKEITAKDICSQNIITLSPEEHLYKALMLMIKHNIRHIVITEKNGELEGILSINDLIRSKESGALNIANIINSAKKIQDLIDLRYDIDLLMRELVNKQASVGIICEIINDFYDQLTRKIIEISESEMIEEGYGSPPANYSFISMGSSGRKEQLMRTDMDNGIIFAEPYKKDEKEVKNYFLILGEKIILGLIKCGFMECPGKMMANNPDWCRSLKSWRKLIKKWAEAPDVKTIRSMTIFLDFRHIYGEKRYYDILKDFVVKTFKESTVTHQYLIKNILINKPPIGAFKRIKFEKDNRYGNWIDLKKSAYVHIVETMKVFSLREGIQETNTYERLKRLQEKNVFSDDEAKSIHGSYEVFMMFTLQENIEKKKQRIIPDNRVALHKLSAWEKNILKESLLIIDNLHNLVSQSFQTSSYL